uniref:Uncharacterized protein n=1 Tax=Anguilla anguilla TaxID=7936 RepID=A0A0E9QLE2_ANGAN
MEVVNPYLCRYKGYVFFNRSYYARIHRFAPNIRDKGQRYFSGHLSKIRHYMDSADPHVAL